jgi:amino acid transporter
MAAVLASRTYAELEAMVADLPSAQPARRRSVIPASPVARVAIAVAVLVPVVVVAIAVFAAFFSAWIIWALIGWFIFGHHHRHGYYRHSHRRYGPRHAQRQAGAGPGRGFWT